MGGSAGEEGGRVIRSLTIKNADDPGRPLHAAVNPENGTLSLALGESITACRITLSRPAVNELLHLIQGDAL